MSPSKRNRNLNRNPRQCGFAIVSAIFLLVALAVLGAYMVSFSNTQHITSAQDVQGARAYWTAKGAVQWAAAAIIKDSACPIGNPDFGNGFNVLVSCVSQAYTEGLTVRPIYWVTATASSAGTTVGSMAYVERQVQVFIDSE